MRMSRPELLCGILVNSFRLQILVSLNSLHGICFARRSQPNNAKGSQLVKVMCMSRPELLCGIPVHSFRLQILVSHLKLCMYISDSWRKATFPV